MARAMPVGSRTLTQRHHLGVSSATVRNDLPPLEGRATSPTPYLGRAYTHRRGGVGRSSTTCSSGLAEEEDPHSEIVNELRSSARELDALMEQTSAALMRLIDCLSIVVAPSMLSAHVPGLAHLAFQPLRADRRGGGRQAGSQSPDLSFTEEVAPDELAAVQNLLNRVFAGKSPREFRAACEAQTLETLRDPLVQYVLRRGPRLPPGIRHRPRPQARHQLAYEKSQSSVRLPLCCL